MAALTMNRMIEQVKARPGRRVTAVDWVANTMPWAGSAIPAVMTYKNVQKLGFLPWQAFVIGAVVEGMGFVSITTALDIYEANRAERAINPSRPLLDGPFWVATAGAAVYLGAVLMVNAILDGGTPGEKLTLALLSLFGVIGGIMVALRNQLAKRVAENEQASVERSQEAEQARAANEAQAREELEYRRGLEREEAEHRRKLEEEALENKRRADEEERERKFRLKEMKVQAKVAESGVKVVESGTKVSESRPETFGKWRRWPEVPDEERRRIAVMTVEQVMATYGVEERTAYHWIEYAQKWVKEATND